MKKSPVLLAATMLACAALTPAAQAADEAPAKTLSPQQQRMKDCNAQAKTQDLHGDPRKAFMKTCLSGGSSTGGGAAADASPAAGARAAQQDKMKSCNAEAKSKGLAGADRKSFMSTCLKAG